MKYQKCNEKCEPEKGLHWLGDRMITEKEVRVCVLCGCKGVPHYGFGFPCVASKIGSHQGQRKEER